MKTKYLLYVIFTFLYSLTLHSQETIYDIQFTEDPYGDSPYLDQEVNITGIVTSSAHDYDLGYVFIQDEGGGPWSGIMLNGSGLSELYRKEEVTVTGTVYENEGVTQINVSSFQQTGQLKEIISTDIDPSDSTDYQTNGFEKWESVLVRYKSSDGSELYISHPKVNPNNNFGDYAVSPKTKSASKNLGLILAGRQTSNIISSLWVQIVNDPYWYDNSGQMQVTPIIASPSIVMVAVLGIMTYGYGNYRLLPRNNDDFEDINVELDPTDLAGSPLSTDEWLVKKVQVSPNPTSGNIRINASSKISEINIYDLTGNLVFSQKSKADNQEINVSSLSDGTYFMQLKTTKNELISTKIVVLK